MYLLFADWVDPPLPPSHPNMGVERVQKMNHLKGDVLWFISKTKDALVWKKYFSYGRNFLCRDSGFAF